MSANPRNPLGPETVLIAQQSSFSQSDAVLRLLQEEFGHAPVPWPLLPEVEPVPASKAQKAPRSSFWRRVLHPFQWRRLPATTSSRSGGMERIGGECSAAQRLE